MRKKSYIGYHRVGKAMRLEKVGSGWLVSWPEPPGRARSRRIADAIWRYLKAVG